MHEDVLLKCQHTEFIGSLCKSDLQSYDRCVMFDFQPTEWW